MSEPFDFSFQQYLDTDLGFCDDLTWDFTTAAAPEQDFARAVSSSQAAEHGTSHTPANDVDLFLTSNHLLNDSHDEWTTFDKSVLTTEYTIAIQAPTAGKAGSLTDLTNEIVR